MSASFEEVLAFWFPRDASSVDAARMRWWFAGGADAEIARRFVPTHELAARGELDAWAASPRSRLALILVLDQFTRTLARGTAAAFAQDAQALSLTRAGVENGHYAALATPWEKTFFLLPLGHSVDRAAHELSVKLSAELAVTASPESKRLLEHSASQARAHRDVIARFGRHPHRNLALGRESTPAEREYLANETPVHLRPPPQ